MQVSAAMQSKINSFSLSLKFKSPMVPFLLCNTTTQMSHDLNHILHSAIIPTTLGSWANRAGLGLKWARWWVNSGKVGLKLKVGRA